MSESSANRLALLVYDIERAAAPGSERGRGEGRPFAVLRLAAASIVVGIALAVLHAYSESPRQSSWIHDGQPMKVTTPREPGESDAKWLARHAEGLHEMKRLFPPDHLSTR